VEPAKKYNKRAQKAVDSFHEQGSSLAIIGRGRSAQENSLVLLENGNYLGFGFFDKQESIKEFDSARNFIKTGKDNRTVQNLINSFLVNPRGAEVVLFE
jgi:DNA polymerase-3 subunit epsilon